MFFVEVDDTRFLLACLQIKVAPKQVQNEEKGDESAPSLAVEEKENDHKPFTTLEELKSGRLPPEEILSLPMFKVLCFFTFAHESHAFTLNLQLLFLVLGRNSVTWLVMFLLMLFS